MASYKDIQRETGLSLATISKYFNDKNVLPENREAIERAAQALGFQPNGIARSLRRQRSGTVGVLLPALNNDFHLTIIANVEETLRAEGFSVIVASSDPSGRAVELLLRQRVEGIITVPTEHDIPGLLAAQGTTPLVVVDWEAPGLTSDAIFLDNEAAGRIAARQLLDHGHTRVALIGGEDAISTMRERRSGFSATLAAAGHPLAADCDAHVPLSVSAGREAMSRVLAAPTRPTAAFCANYELTVGAVIAINESGLRIGRDISLIGFDSVELGRVTVPPMTMIAQPTAEIGRRAARLLLQRLGDGSDVDPSPGVTRLPPRLVAGGTVVRQNDGEH